MDSKHSAMASVAPGHWRRAENPDRSRRIDLTFPGAADTASLQAQLDTWLDALERCIDFDAALGERAALLIPSRGDSAATEAPILHFPAPARVGAGILAGKRAPADVLDVLRRIATALDALHARSFIHGAVGISSLWWMRDGSLRFADAGLMHLLDGVVSPPKMAGAYLAPEVWRRAGIVPASDQYGLAVIAFELFTGRVRYVEDASNGVQSLQPLTLEAGQRLYDGAPAELNDVMQRALSTSPSSRYGSCMEFVEALDGHATAAKSLPTVHGFAGLKAGFRRQTAVLAVATIAILGASAYVMRASVKQRAIGGLDFDLEGVAYAAREKAGALPTIDIPSSGTRSASSGSGGITDRASNSASNQRSGSGVSVASPNLPGRSASAQPGAAGSGAATPAGLALRSRAAVLARDLKRAVPGTEGVSLPAYSTQASSRGATGGETYSGGREPGAGSAPSGGSTGGRASTGTDGGSRGSGSAGSSGGAGSSGSVGSSGSAGRTGSTGVMEGLGSTARTGGSRATTAPTPARVAVDSAAARPSSPATAPAVTTLAERLSRLIRGAPTAQAVPLASGTLHLKGPSGARYYVDGVLVRPVRGKVTLNAGEHDVDIVIPNGSIFRRRVTVTGGQTLVVKR